MRRGSSVTGAQSTATADERALSQYIRNEWQSDKGFPGGQVFAITQTTDGYLWIGAEKGLVRFDGLRFQLFEPRGSAANSGPTVLGVAAAPDGSVWARLRGAGLVRYRAGNLETISSGIGPPETIVTAMVRARDDSMIVATLGFGTVAYRAGRFEVLTPQQSMPGSSFVISIAEAGTGETWFGTRDAGLLRVHQSRVERVADGLPDLKVNCLLDLPGGGLWVGTDKGIARWTGTGITREGIPAPLHTVPALMMLRDGQGSVWIAAGARGLLRVDRDGRVNPSGGDPSVRSHVSTLFEDRDGNIWVGTNCGIERWRAPTFTSYTTAQGLPADTIGPVYVDAADRTWFAPTSGGIVLVRERRRSAGGCGRSRARRGLFHRRRPGRHLGRPSAGRPHPPRSNGRDIRERAPHRQERAGAGQRVCRASGARWNHLGRYPERRRQPVQRLRAFTTYDMTHGLASNTVASILDGRDGTVWFATPNGVSRLSRGGWRTYTQADGLPASDTNVLFEDRDANLWVGTVAGLAVIGAGAVRASSAFPSSLGASIFGITEDTLGFLWIATAAGVVRVNRRDLLGAAPDGASVRTFGLQDGLPALEGVKRHRSMVAGSHNRIWMSLARAGCRMRMRDRPAGAVFQH